MSCPAEFHKLKSAHQEALQQMVRLHVAGCVEPSVINAAALQLETAKQCLKKQNPDQKTGVRPVSAANRGR